MKITCSCGQRIEVNDDARGQVFNCPTCGNPLLAVPKISHPETTRINLPRPQPRFYYTPGKSSSMSGLRIGLGIVFGLFAVVLIYLGAIGMMPFEQAINGLLGWGVLLALFYWVFVPLYCLPTTIARQNNHRNIQAISVLNLFAGWTIIAWIVALVWANTK